MPVAEAYKDVLPEDHREALHLAIEVLTDQFFEDQGNLVDNGNAFRFTTMADYLPTIYSDRYDAAFATKFLVTTIIVGQKLCEPEPLMLTCVAEELALNALIERAADLLEVRDRSADFSDFRQATYEDFDYKYLFDPSLDGIDESPTGAEMGMADLGFANWFEPFRDEYPVHPWLTAATEADLPGWFRDAP